jgi:hypothetical protein
VREVALGCLWRLQRPLKTQQYQGIQPALRPRATKNENAELAKADSAFFVCICGLVVGLVQVGGETLTTQAWASSLF